jgi:hypothetical protein
VKKISEAMMRGRLVCSEDGFQLLRKLFASFLCLSIICASVPTPSIAQVPSLAASTALNAAGLGALAVGVHGLVNDAISQANQDLEDRLRQLEAIVNSALFSLTTAINYGIDKLDATMQANLRVLNDNAQQLLARYGALTKATLAQAQAYLTSDIDQAGNALGNAVAQVNFLNTTPILNVPTNGIAIFRAYGNTTDVFVTGVGLTKLSVVPEVKIFGPNKSVAPVTVEANTMAFLKLSIPTNFISRDGTYTLSFNFCVGRYWVGLKEYAEQKISVLVCPIPRFSISTKLWVEGDAWETRIRNLNEGNLANGAIYGVQCPSGNGNSRLPITAQASPGWELYDPGWGRLINCVRNASNGYTDLAYAGGNTCIIYADGRNGDAHLNVVAQVAERHRVHKNQCGNIFLDNRDLIGTVASSFDFPRASLNGDCDSGVVLKALFKSNLGDVLTDQHGFLANDQVSVDVVDGVTTLKSAPQCRERAYGEVVVAPK